MQDLIKDFMNQKNIAVAGSFKNETKFAYKILKKLICEGYTVYPITPSFKQVEGLVCYKSVLDIPARVDAIDIVTPPAVTENIVKECLRKGISRAWMQPGAESESAIEFCKLNNIKVIYNACLLNA